EDRRGGDPLNACQAVHPDERLRAKGRIVIDEARERAGERHRRGSFGNGAIFSQLGSSFDSKPILPDTHRTEPLRDLPEGFAQLLYVQLICVHAPPLADQCIGTSYSSMVANTDKRLEMRRSCRIRVPRLMS